MKTVSTRCMAAALVLTLVCSAAASAQDQQPYEPVPGQAGKDVVWVPTPPELVEKMLDVAQLTPQDYVIDLGSGDGRNVIAAAKRGATALGVEYNPEMVNLSRQKAAAEGVSDKATFVEGDMFAADISKATVLALFLLPDNLRRLTPKFTELRPGTRIVSNTFGIEGWDADYTETMPDCSAWCTVLLWVVPAKVAGTWQLGDQTLTLEQEYQKISGTLGGTAVTEGRLRGTQITFKVGDTEYTGTVNGNAIQGTAAGAAFTATRAN